MISCKSARRKVIIIIIIIYYTLDLPSRQESSCCCLPIGPYLHSNWRLIHSSEFPFSKVRFHSPSVIANSVPVGQKLKALTLLYWRQGKSDYVTTDMHLGAGLIGLPLHFTVPVCCMLGMLCNWTEFVFLMQLMESVRRKFSGVDIWGCDDRYFKWGKIGE